MQVPFLDLKAQHQFMREEIRNTIDDVLDTCAFAGGPFVEEFERDFASFCGCHDAVGVGSGTVALWMALQCSGIGPGDEVITVPNTFIATAEAISACGARPVFVDIDERNYTMDPRLLRAAITSQTKAIIPVHLYGQMCCMDPIMAIARAAGISVIEDACQAHGAEYKERPAGSIGDAGCFSFYPGKNLGACGEAGAIVTNDKGLAECLRTFRDHGQRRKYYHSIIGWNARMDGFQGAVLRKKLKYLPMWTESRRSHASRYRELLEGIDGIVLPVEEPYGRPVYHVFVVRLTETSRDEVIAELKERGVICGIHYPVPIHLQDAYQGLGYGPGSFPVAERCARQLLSLPMYAELTDAQIELVCHVLRNLVACGVG